MLELNVYKNNDETSEQYNQCYARVDYKETYDIPKLAKHMAQHNTPFSEGTIAGILTDMVACIRHLTLDGNHDHELHGLRASELLNVIITLARIAALRENTAEGGDYNK